tara:strand:- start:106 stop:213 length:108 start_codon:yes stop_codon:yes gene_type:complete
MADIFGINDLDSKMTSKKERDEEAKKKEEENAKNR